MFAPKGILPPIVTPLNRELLDVTVEQVAGRVDIYAGAIATCSNVAPGWWQISATNLRPGTWRARGRMRRKRCAGPWLTWTW